MKFNFLPIIFLIIIIAIVYYIHDEYYRIPSDVPIPTELHPIVNKQTNELIEQSAEKGINIVITDDFRSVEKQETLYEQGRSTEGNIVTYAKGGDSYHNYGLAIDFALRLNNGEVIWDLSYDGNNNAESDWIEVVEIAKELGFEWGGDWDNFQDYPHLQMTFGLSIWNLKRGKRPELEDK